MDDRREFLKAAGLILASQNHALARPLTEKDKLARIASNTWPMRFLFKSRSAGRRSNPQAGEMKRKYGEITDEVNHPFCEASPDFCNWEHEYMLYHGLEALAPYTHSIVHAKTWNRWSQVDVQRCVRILTNAKYMGIFALEYEAGPWDGVEGAKYLFKEVMAAL